MGKKKSTMVVTDPAISHVARDGKQVPALSFEGELPEAGQIIRAEFNNGSAYTGTVLEAVEIDGKVMVDLADGLAPAT